MIAIETNLKHVKYVLNIYVYILYILSTVLGTLMSSSLKENDVLSKVNVIWIFDV